MARSLGTLTISLLLKAGSFETDAGRAARIADKEAKAIARSFDAAGKAIGLALAAGITTVGAAVVSAINHMDDLSKAAQRANMPTEQFSALAHAANLADVSMQDLQGAMGKLAKAQGEALSSTSTQAKMFDALGISAKNADGSLRDTADVFLDFADKFQKFKGSPEIMAAGMQLFGRSFQNLIPLLKDGSAGLRDAMQEAKDLGLVLSTTAGANAEQFNDNLSRMKTLAGGLGMSLASELLPRMVAFTDNAVEMVKAAGGAEGIMRKLSGAFDTMLTVAKAAGVYIGTTYAASIGIAAARMIAAAAATGTWTAATLGLTGAMTALRTAAAFLLGPAGLIAAGVTGVYLLATRQTEAEKAAIAHKEAMDLLSISLSSGTENAAQQSATLKQNAVDSLNAAKAKLELAKAQFAIDAASAKDMARYGSTDRGDLAGMRAGVSAERLTEQQALVAQLEKNITDIDKALISAGVNKGFDVIIPPAPELNLRTEAVSKSAKAVKSLADQMREWGREDEAAMRRQIEAEATARDRWESMQAQLQGPLAQAMYEHKQRLLEIAAAGKAAGASAAEIEVALQAEKRRFAELDPLYQNHIMMLEDLQDAGVYAFQRMAQAMGDFVGRGFRGVKDMWSQIKDAFKRGVSDVVAIMLNASFVRPLQNWLGQMLGMGGSQGMAGLTSGQGGLGAIMNNGFDRLLSGITGIFSRGGSAAQAMQTATEAGWQMAKAAGVAVVPVGQAGGMMLPNGSLLGGGSSIFGGLSGMLGPLLGVGLGASMGGDTLGKIGGGLTGGALAYSMLMSGGGLAGLSAGMASGGLFGGLSGMAGAMGPIGWTALAAMAVNKLTGGKLFGTSYKTESASQQWSVSEAGASGSQSVTEVKQQSFFRGRKWRTTTSALDAEAMAAVNELFLTLEKTVQTAAQQLGIDVPDIVGGSFKREFDKNGNLTREFGTIAGRVYNEAQDAFAARLVGENMLAVAKAAGSSAELEQLANAYRGTGEQLQAFATLALAVQEDLRSANGIWQQVDGDGVMTRIVGYVEGLAKAGESLADAYTRIQQTVQQYGDLIGGVRTQLATRGLNQYQKAQLDVELAYRKQVKTANELAKSLGLSGARAEDLAAIEQLRALSMADLAKQYATQQQAQNQRWLEDLGLSDLSPLKDAQKLANGMDLLRQAAGAGDAQRAQKLAEQVLGLGRNLYASGADYNALYQQVTALVGDLNAASMEDLQGLTNEELANLASLVDSLPARIAQEFAGLLLAPPPTATVPQLPPAPTPQPPPPSGGGGGGGYDPGSGGRCVAAHMVMDDGTLAENADAGNVHATHDPAEGFMRHAIRARGEAVWQPCVRLVTAGGAALVCSASTPFTAPDAPADLPEYTTLAPDMLGREVIVERAGLRLVERVVDVQDVGMHLVIPLDFGGRSFPAGEDAGALIYSHNMQKVPDYGSDALLRSMAVSLASIAETNSAMASSDIAGGLLDLSKTTRTGR